MSKKLKITLSVIFVFVFLGFASFGDTRTVNSLFTLMAAVFVVYVVYRTVIKWKDNPQAIWHGENFKEQVKLSNLTINPNKNPAGVELPEILSNYDNKIVYTLDIISIIYWVVFGLLVFSILQPLHGSAQAQNGMQFMQFFVISIPLSVIILSILGGVFFKKFVNKIKVNKSVFNRLFETLLLPIFLTISFFIALGVSSSVYSNEYFYTLAKNNLFEPIIRIGVITILIFLVNKKRFFRIFKVSKTIN